MTSKFYSLLICCLLFSGLFAQTIVTINDEALEGDKSYTWTKDNVYLLDGFVFLEEGSSLTIEAGTVIKGKQEPSTGDLASTLVIARGAQIFANGTADAPIIFTAELDDLNIADDFTADDRGQWGGLILLGSGQIARPGGTDVVEGLPAADPRSQYGGDNDDDNSGILRYVSIRHGGAALSSGNEINGLTLGGVGSGTTVEYVEVFANFDDGIEWFGGKVNAKYLSVSFCGDDGMDYDYGWRGKGQFWFVMHGEGPLEAGRGGEHDGAKPDGESPFSKPTIYNATYFGSGKNPFNFPDGDGNDYALVFRDRAGGTYANSIFTDYSDRAISIEDLPGADGEDSYANLLNGDLALNNNLWFGFGGGSTFTELVEIFKDGDDSDATGTIAALVATNNILVDPQICGISRTDDGGLDPRVKEGSPALSNTIDEPAGDTFFTDVNYKGAFASSPEGNWLMGWTALSELGYLGNQCLTLSAAAAEDNGFSLRAINPNPVSNGLAEVVFELPRSAKVSLEIYDLQGRQLLQPMAATNLPAGVHNHTLRLNQLAGGAYIILLRADDQLVLSRKFIVE